DAADDWIVEHIAAGDVCVTADIPLAARCLAKGAKALAPNGRVWDGDNIGGARIVGTDEHFFELRSSQQAAPAFQLAEGRIFEANFEAVLGSRAATELGLRLGDQFRPAHGVEPGLEGDDHAEVHTVVGILRPSDTPFDNAVVTTVNSVIQMHAEAHDAAEFAVIDAHAEETNHEAGDSSDDATIVDAAHHEEDAHIHDDHPSDDNHDHAIEGQVTAVLVAPVGFIEANQIWREFYTGAEAQAVFPGRELGGLFDLLNQGQEILIVVGYLAAVMAALTLFLAIYSATESRQHLLAILRGVGASRRTIMLVVLAETVLVAMLGALFGRLLGYAVAAAIAGEISRRSAIPVTISWLPQMEPALWLLPLALGVLAGLLPAWQAYRVNVVEKLFPS
ncbi:MAG: DUF188 domain-containing protein, partial [Caldilinea sp.]